MKTFTLTGAMTAVALCLALPGAALAASHEQKAMPPAASDQQPSAKAAATEDESKAEDEAAATEEEGKAEDEAAATEEEDEAKDEAATEEEPKAEDEAAATEEEGEAKDEAATTASAEGTAVVGQKLYGAGDDSFGVISNVLFADGKAHAVVVDIGGFLGIGAKTVAIPMDQISVEGDRVVAMGLTSEDAEALPEWKEPREEPPAPTGTPGAQPSAQPGAQPAMPAQPTLPGQGKTQ